MSEKVKNNGLGDIMLFGSLGLIFLIKILEKIVFWFESSFRHQLLAYGIFLILFLVAV